MQLALQGVENLEEQPFPIHTRFSKKLIVQFVQRRKELGYTQEYVDQMMGNTPGQIAKWETGIRKPTLFNAYAWAEVLHTEIILRDE